MAKLWSTLHTPELSLLVAMIFYANSLVLICDHFLISSQITMFITFISLTCFFLLICHFLIKGSKLFVDLYWNFFFRLAAYMTTTGHSKDWKFSRGVYSVLIGCTFLALYTLYTWVFPPCQNLGQEQQEEQSQNLGHVVPLPVEISVIFMGNGVALMGRCCFFHSDEWMLVGATLMFLASAVFFSYYYYLYSSVKVKPIHVEEDIVNLHQD